MEFVNKVFDTTRREWDRVDVLTTENETIRCRNMDLNGQVEKYKSVSRHAYKRIEELEAILDRRN